MTHLLKKETHTHKENRISCACDTKQKNKKNQPNQMDTIQKEARTERKFNGTTKCDRVRENERRTGAAEKV